MSSIEGEEGLGTRLQIHFHFLCVAFSEAAANFTSGSEDLCEFSSTKLAIQHPEVCPITSTASKCTNLKWLSTIYRIAGNFQGIYVSRISR